MIISVFNRIQGEIALAFVVKEDVKVRAHYFFSALDAADQRYLETAFQKFPLQSDQSRVLMLPSGRKVLMIGVSAKAKFNNRKAILAARRVIAAARTEKIMRVAASLDDFRVRPPAGRAGAMPQETGALLATQFIIANFEFIKYKTPPKEGWAFVEEAIIATKSQAVSLRRAVREGAVIGEEINEARVLANTPGGDMTPARLAEAAVEAGKRHGIKVAVFDEKRIAEIGMGGVQGVAKGSSEKPRFIVMEYLRGKKSEHPVVLAGKGVTFDTGGLNLKPGQSINEMHMDMSGGAAVIHTIAALARLKAKKNVIGLIPAVENMLSGSSYRPGDLLRMLSGKTVEVLNTDAEGRIILADALEYAKRYNPRLVIDVATLTGAAMVALGQRASALFATSVSLERQLRDAGEAAGDFVWPLPLWEEYEEDTKGTFGDLVNAEKNRYGGAINGATFLRQFIRDASGKDAYPWAHIDITPRMTTIDGEFLAKGAAGASVALLARFLRKF